MNTIVLLFRKNKDLLNKLLLGCIFILLLQYSLPSHAQALGESPLHTHYISPLQQQGRLMNETGLGNRTTLLNLPDVWTFSYKKSHFLPYLGSAWGDLQPILTGTNSQKVILDLKGSQLGELDFNALLNPRLSDHIKLNIFLNGHWNRTKQDQNQDGFLDLPFRKRLFNYNRLLFKYKAFNSENVLWWWGINTQGGQLAFDKKSDYSTTNAYGYGSNAWHGVFKSSNNWLLDSRKVVSAQLHFKNHRQSDYYGLRLYEGDQTGGKVNVGYVTGLDDDKTNVLAGINYEYVQTTEKVDSVSLERKESMVGGFVGTTTSFFKKKLAIEGRVNLMYHNLAKLIIAPNLKLQVKYTDDFKGNFFGGRGVRFANLLHENQRYLLSNRSIQFNQNLRPEEAWYYGTSLHLYHQINKDKYNTIRARVIANITYRHTLYQQQIVADVEQAQVLQFYNLEGLSNRHTLETGFSIYSDELQAKLDIDYKLDDWRTSYQSGYQLVPLHSVHTLRSKLEYAIKKYDRKLLYLQTTVYWYSPQRLPQNSIWGNQSKGVWRWDTRADFEIYPILKAIFKKARFPNKHEASLYVGVDNILQSVLQQPFVGADTPFGNSFDGGLRWQSMVGRRFYVGFRIIL